VKITPAKRALARRIARCLFTDGYGRRWPSLMHFTKDRQATASGWCESAAAYAIMEVLSKPAKRRRKGAR
jgi:hypothetical protein